MNPVVSFFTTANLPAVLAAGPLQASSLIGTLVIGLIVGAVAKLLTPGRDPGGCIITMLIGVIGAALATFLGHVLGFYGENQAAGFIGSLVGAVLVLVIYHLITRGRGAGPGV